MRRKTRPVLVVLGALALLGFGACGDDEPAPSATGNSIPVAVDDNFFEPTVATVAVGDTVVWEWVGTEPHDVVDVVTDEFSTEIETEGTFEHTFDTAGTFDYVCQIHPGMEGTIEVTA